MPVHTRDAPLGLLEVSVVHACMQRNCIKERQGLVELNVMHICLEWGWPEQGLSFLLPSAHNRACMPTAAPLVAF
jgi:hypothetical protein